MSAAGWVFMYFAVGFFFDFLVVYGFKNLPDNGGMQNETMLKVSRVLILFLWPLVLLVGLLVSLFNRGKGD